jgi:hypothetical protein
VLTFHAADYWILIIAVCTFFLLADHQVASEWITHRPWVVWVVAWIFPIIWASLALGIAGYTSSGAWCSLPSDKARLLVNFVPRWLIIIVILVLYLRLYFILRRAHQHFSMHCPTNFNPATRRNTQMTCTHANHGTQPSMSEITHGGSDRPQTWHGHGRHLTPSRLEAVSPTCPDDPNHPLHKIKKVCNSSAIPNRFY